MISAEQDEEKMRRASSLQASRPRPRAFAVVPDQSAAQAIPSIMHNAPNGPDRRRTAGHATERVDAAGDLGGGERMRFIFLVGDVHGEHEKLLHVLRRAGLLGINNAWTGRNSILCFTGDYVDRGPDGIAVIEFVRRLERQARAAGGEVRSLLGNHDVLLLAAHRYGTNVAPGVGVSFRGIWEDNGGRASELERLGPEHIAWLGSRPAMMMLGERLVVHVDSTLYATYGRTIAAVNRAFSSVLASNDTDEWARLLVEMTRRNEFAGRRGTARAIAMLARFGGRQIIHGHTPISNMTGLDPTITRWPLTYAGGRCVNIDGGMYYGGPGFVLRLPPLTSLTEHLPRRAPGGRQPGG